MSVKRFTCFVAAGMNDIGGPMRLADDGGWVLAQDYDVLAAELAELKKHVPLKGGVPLKQFMQEERIRELEVALLEGVKAVNGLLAKNKGLTAYKVAGDWRESVKTLVVNYGTAEHPCSVPPPQQDTP